jgi:ABC-type uncharacterized transport system YnjBCD ATPase subunit
MAHTAHWRGFDAAQACRTALEHAAHACARAILFFNPFKKNEKVDRNAWRCPHFGSSRGSSRSLPRVLPTHANAVPVSHQGGGVRKS